MNTEQRRGLKIGGISFVGLIILLVGTVPVSAQQNVRITEMVNDYAGVIDPNTRQSLNAWLKELELRVGAQVIVLTIDSTGGRDMYQYAMDIAKRERLGQKKENNGVLIVIAVKDRKWRIVTGEGIEDTLPDVYCDSIAQDYFLPNFRKGDYSSGVYFGVVAIAKKIAEEKGIQLTGIPAAPAGRVANARRGRGGGGAAIGSCFTTFIILIVIASILGSRRRRYYGSWGGGSGFWTGVILSNLLNSGRRGGGWSGGSSWGGGGGGGGGFGGFGGGGGGSFGGGGAGGSW